MVAQTESRTKLFRLQKYKKFESNSQLALIIIINVRVVSTAKVQKIWEQFTTAIFDELRTATLFRLQKYKKFESNSQLLLAIGKCDRSCFDCKSTKNLRAIHNYYVRETLVLDVVSTAKVQKIWEQFTTITPSASLSFGCFDCKSTKNLRAIHNTGYPMFWTLFVVSTAKVQKIWEQFTTGTQLISQALGLFRLQKYKKFESNSQQWNNALARENCCFDCKSTKNLRAIHNWIWY